MSCLSGFFLLFHCLKMDPRRKSPVASACRIPFSFPLLCTPHFPINDFVSGAAFNWAVEVPDFRSTIPAFLTTRFWSLCCFTNACCWLTSAWHPHGISSFFSHTRRSFYPHMFIEQRHGGDGVTDSAFLLMYHNGSRV